LVKRRRRAYPRDDSRRTSIQRAHANEGAYAGTIESPFDEQTLVFAAKNYAERLRDATGIAVTAD
jgi:hypothetical protein